MSNLNRRDFLKVLGVTGTSTLAACDTPDTALTRTLTPIENLFPYVVQPEQIVPGLSTYFASQCQECDVGCGVVMRNREGRIIKLEGNPQHPVNKGSICSRGQAGIQATYSPDRLETPMKGGAASTWEDAVGAISGALKGKKVAWLGRHRTGSLAALIGDFLGAVGSSPVFWEPLGDHALQAATKAVYGIAGAPRFVLDDAHTIVTFGKEILGVAGDPSHARGYGISRDPNHGGYVSRLVSISSRVGSTGALSDLHLGAKAGTEAGLAMALASLVAEKKHYSGPAAALLSGIDAKAASEAAGIKHESLVTLAGWLAEHPSVVLPGGPATSSAATSLATAVLLLNEVAGNVGHSVVFNRHVNTAGRGTWADAKALLDACAAGKVDVLFLDELDPVYNMPADSGAAAALAKVGTVVVFANEVNESIPEGAWVLPPGTTIEAWGDSQSHKGVFSLQQPGMEPLFDTKAQGDVLLALAKAAGLGKPAAAIDPAAAPAAAPAGEAAAAPAAGEVAAPAPIALPGLDSPHYRAYLADYWKAVVWDAAGRPGTFEAFWIESLQRGGYWTEGKVKAPAFALAKAPATGATTPSGDGLVLTVFAHPFLADGRHANKPWAQEVPEPLSSFAWGTWVELNPKTAESLGLVKDGKVTVKTATGEVEAGWFGSPGIREDTVAIVLGNGRKAGGRYTRYGANPMSLLTTQVDEGGAFKFVSTTAKVAKAQGVGSAVRYLGSLDLQGRTVNDVVSIEDRGKTGVNSGNGIAFDSPGGIVPVTHHHPPVDARLREGGFTDMYPEPNHPTYRFAMAIDLNKCTGCGACETACYAENNSPVVGPDQMRKSRHMGWIRLSRYWEGEGEHQDVRFQPVMCQHCSLAPCEGVCPVLATYHNLDGLNAMIYNRCVGTRYCGNNCPYSARRFNYHSFQWPESFQLMLNPDVVTREMGVMEKCTFCIQRIRAIKDEYRDNRYNGSGESTTAPDKALLKLTACAQACPADAITFGNTNDPEGVVTQLYKEPRAYSMLGELNTKPGVRYLARIVHTQSKLHHGDHHAEGGDHGAEGGHGGGGDHGKTGGADHGKAGGAAHGNDDSHSESKASGEAAH